MFIFIVNPVSGKGKSLEAVKIIKEYCKSKFIKNKICYTTDKGEAKEFATIYKDNNIIFSVGGDGTLNEVVNGIAQGNSKLGIVPVGTGNDFYKSIKNFNDNKIDLGKVNNKYFINIASLGLDAEVADRANTLKEKKLPNNIVYIMSLMNKFFTYKPINMKIDKEEKSSTILAICNGKYYGNGFKIAPYATMNDGLFDIVDCKSLKKLEIINLLSKLVQGNHLESSKVNFYRSDYLNIRSNTLLNCNIDGEIIKDFNFEFSIEKDALSIDIENSKKINEILKVKKLIK